MSITEMEYNRAVERGIPRLIFVMHEDHPLKAADFETGTGADKLKAFKQRLGVERVVNFFKSPDDLRAQVLHSLSQMRPHPAAITDATATQALHAYLARAVARYEARLRATLLSRELPTEPFRGLLPFQLEDRAIFFGRDAAIDDLHGVLLKDRLTVVQARSGAGKTSLLHAGLGPRLIEEGRLPVYARPYEDPTLAVRRALASPAEEPWPELLASLSLPQFLGLACARLSRQTRELVLVLDQFEEFFVFWPQREQRQPFVDALAECYHDRSLPVRIVLAIREDYFGRLYQLRGPLPSIFQNLYELEPMTRLEAEAAITGPVKALGKPVHYEPVLLDALLDDLARGGMELPHLQIICTRLYKELREDETAITLRSYQALGEARDILGRYLKDVLERLPGNGAPLARQVLKALVSSESTRWVRSERELAAAMQAEPGSLAEILDSLVRDRVLQREEVDDEIRYQLAHEYLIQEVGKWLDSEDLTVKQAQELLQRQLASWKSPHKLLMPNEALRLVHEQREALPKLSDDELELVFRSALAADFEVPYWRDHAPAVVGKVEQELFGGLASEAQWEKAARGTDGRRYPWGSEFDTSKCNTSESGIGDTTSVGKYSKAGGDSPYGVADMAGNVWEWTKDLYRPYPYRIDDGRGSLEDPGNRVLRGGSWHDDHNRAASSSRTNAPPGYRYLYWGVRVVAGLAPPF